MSATLIDSVRSAFTPDVLSKIAVLLGETESRVQKAIQGAVPMVVTDILHKSYYPDNTARVSEIATRAAAGDFFGELHELSVSPGGLVPASNLLNKGSEYAHSLLGPRFDPVVNEISRFSGASLPSASFITGIVSFAALDAVGRHVAHYNADAGSFSGWLRPQVEGIRPAIPAGLQVREALGIHHYPWEKPAKRSRNTALYVAMVLILVLVGAFFVYRYHQDHPGAFAPTTDTLAPASAAAPAK
jgi:hypothetical protein